MPQYYLTDRDREILTELFAFVKSRKSLSRQNNPDPDDSNSAPDVYVVKTPTAGIAAIYEPDGTGSSPEASYASCQIYTLTYNPDDRKTYVVAIPGLTAYIYNLGSEAAAGDTWCLVNRIKQGYWVLTDSSTGGGSSTLEVRNWRLTSDFVYDWITNNLGNFNGWTDSLGNTSPTMPTFPSSGYWRCTFNITGSITSATGPAYLSSYWYGTGAASLISDISSPYQGGVIASELVPNGGNYSGAGTLSMSAIFRVPNHIIDGMQIILQAFGDLAGTVAIAHNGTIYSFINTVKQATTVLMEKVGEI